MSDTIDIGMGELSVSKNPSTMVTSGVGSCVVICLFSASQKAGAMAHIMLPKRLVTSIPIDETQYKYADVAIPVMLDSLEKEGIRRMSLVAKIAGGANMFPDVQGRSQKVGEKNIEAVRSILGENKITISGEHVGGTVGRTVRFDLGNGIVVIQSNI